MTSGAAGESGKPGGAASGGFAPSRRWFGLAIVIVILDQVAKFALFRSVAPGETVVVTPFFNIVHVYNTGAAFSFLAWGSGWQRMLFIGIALAASVWISWMLVRHAGERLLAAALTLVLGGAIGNVLDRIRIGAVLDFIQVHAAGWYFPAFNVADSAISCGAALLVWEAFRGEHARRGAAAG